LLVATPEVVRLRLEAAGLGSRGLAYLIDLGIKYGIVAQVVFILEALRLNVLAELPTLSTIGLIVLPLVLFFYQWGYFVVFEYVWHGQTPGKRIMRLRVVQETGHPVTLWEAAIRNLTRYVDLLGPGPVAMVLTRNCQRLGDMASGTVVIKEKRDSLEDIVPPIGGAEGYGLEAEEFEIVADFLRRRETLAPENRKRLAVRLASDLRRILEQRSVLVPQETDDERFLEELVGFQQAPEPKQERTTQK